MFDDEGTKQQNSLWSIWSLTPRVFEKEARDKIAQEALKPRTPQDDPQAENGKSGIDQDSEEKGKKPSISTEQPDSFRKETVVAHWDPDVYRSKILWPIMCLFGAFFGALHLISWSTPFPTLVEEWLWRASAILSIVSMLIFMQFEKVVLRWGGLLTMISLLSPALYLLSRITMIGGVIAAFRASDPAVYETYVVSTYWIHIL